MAEFSLAATKQREVKPYDDITFVLLVGIASFASALINGRTVDKTTYYTLSPDIRASGSYQFGCLVVHLALDSYLVAVQVAEA